MIELMNLRHAAALALVGWYLMMPPWFTDKKPHTEAPMRRWNQTVAFGTKADCTRERLRRLESVSQTLAEVTVPKSHRAQSEVTPDVTEPDETAKALAWSVLALRCIASDDPRLKEK
jgi:hypothetical protein